MKKILKRFYNFLVTCMGTMVSILSVVLFSTFNGNKYFQRQKKMRNKDDECFILGNGASLTYYLENNKEKRQNVFVVNFFGITEYFRELKPDRYIVLDNILIGRAEREFSVEKVKRLYEEIQKVDWPITFYFPSNGDLDIIHKLKKNNNITIVIYNMTPVTGFKFVRHWIYRKSLGMPLPQNISNAAIFCALNSGFKKIYLYGVEHSWMKSFDVDPETHKIYMNDGHFYQKDELYWFNRGEYKNRLLDVYKAMESHFLLREYADSIGAKVINKTPNSFVEAYEFEEY